MARGVADAARVRPVTDGRVRDVLRGGCSTRRSARNRVPRPRRRPRARSRPPRACWPGAAAAGRASRTRPGGRGVLCAVAARPPRVDPGRLIPFSSEGRRGLENLAVLAMLLGRYDRDVADAVLAPARPVRGVEHRRRPHQRGPAPGRSRARRPLRTLAARPLRGVACRDVDPTRARRGRVSGSDAVPDRLDFAALALEGGPTLIETHVYEPPIASEPGERPRTTPLARRQAASGVAKVVNLRNGFAALRDLDRLVVPLLDGTRDRGAVVSELSAPFLRGELHLAATAGRSPTRPPSWCCSTSRSARASSVSPPRCCSWVTEGYGVGGTTCRLATCAGPTEIPSRAGRNWPIITCAPLLMSIGTANGSSDGCGPTRTAQPFNTPGMASREPQRHPNVPMAPCVGPVSPLTGLTPSRHATC